MYVIYLIKNKSVRALYQNKLTRKLQHTETKDYIDEEWQYLTKNNKERSRESLGEKKQSKKVGIRIWSEQIEKTIKY